jgi:glyoxylase-like metal-dependent hydrolase (beta-lactamase superfamily II)
MSGRDEQRLIDLHHVGVERVLGTWLVGDVVVDPGPGSCLQTLLEGLGDVVPRALALTHIHLDHAGASGLLVERWPHLEVWVHERGARHMADPERLLASAQRLYGDDMDRLWGEMRPVPAERMRILRGGETIDGFRVAYTPGHASHHVAYLHEDSGRAFTGDVAGVRIADTGGAARCILAPAPPPDIDVEAWSASLDLLEQWRPASVAPMHFGAYEDVEEHVATLRAMLAQEVEMVRTMQEDDFCTAIRAHVAERTDEQTIPSFELAMPPDQSFQGLLRYLRGRA